MANKEIEEASMSARWVLIQNIHMAPSWISHLRVSLVIYMPNQKYS